MTEPGGAARATRSEWSTPSLLYLVYLSILALQPAFNPQRQWWEWPLVGLIVVVFLPVYVVAESRPGLLRRWAPVLLTLLGTATVLLNSGAVIMFVYAAAYVGDYRSRRTAYQLFAGLSLLTCVLALLSPTLPFSLFSFVPGLIFIWVVGLTSMMGSERGREQAELRLQNARISHLATLTERERISRDLHDVLGQTLTGIVVRSQLAQRLSRTDLDAGVAEMAQVEQAARDALTQVRATVSGWRQVDLDEELTTARAALSTVDVTLVVEREPGIVLTPTVATALGLALREAVTNVVRHAGATRCTVALRRVDDQVVLEITDDGVGSSAAEGNGLSGMRERIGALGGNVSRRVRGGTSLTVAVPAAVAT